MIDIHSHVLFGLDDGARTMEDSVAMARMAAEHGTTDLVATPHASPEYTFQPQLMAERLAAIQAEVGDTLRLHTGCDFHLSFDNIQDAITHPRKYTIDHGQYLLVEFSDLLIFHNTGEIFDRLLQAGMTPVITHPERNDLLRRQIDKIEAWVEAGSRVQVTAQSLYGRFGKRAESFSRQLLDRNLVHVIASDGHDVEHRPPCMDEAHAFLTEHYSAETADLLCKHNPAAALRSEPMRAASSKSQSQGGWRRLLRAFSS